MLTPEQFHLRVMELMLKEAGTGTSPLMIW